MSALTELRKKITGPDGHLLDRATIAAELDKAIAAETICNEGCGSYPHSCAGHDPKCVPYVNYVKTKAE